MSDNEEQIEQNEDIDQVDFISELFANDVGVSLNTIEID